MPTILTVAAEHQALASAIRGRIDLLGWSQAELSRQSGVSVFTVQRLTSGHEGSYRIDVKRKIAASLGWTPDSIDRVLRGDEPILASAAAIPEGTALSGTINISDLLPEDQAAIRRQIENARARRHREGS